MATQVPLGVSSGTPHDIIRAAVKEIIAEIKQLEGGPDAVSDDAPLFSEGLSAPSSLDLDSLDALDLALALKERFDPEGDRFEAFLNGDVDLQSLGTVNKITDFVISLSVQSTNGGSAGLSPTEGARRDWSGRASEL